MTEIVFADKSTINALRILISVNRDKEALTDLKTAMAADEIDWLALLGFANARGVTAQLAEALKEENLETLAPEDIRAFLSDILERTKMRMERQQAQAFETIRAMNEKNVSPILLKSSADLAQGGDIPTILASDLDFLVEDKDAEKSVSTLTDLGYKNLGADDDHTIGVFVRDTDVGALDLHNRALERQDLLTTQNLMERATSQELNGAKWRRLSPTDELIHLILHDQLQDKLHCLGEVNWRNLHRFAVIIKTRGDAIDWVRIKEFFTNAGLTSSLLAYCDAARSLAGAKPPNWKDFAPLQPLWRWRRTAQMRFPLFQKASWRTGKFAYRVLQYLRRRQIIVSGP